MEKAILVTVKLDYDKSTWDVVEMEHELKELAMTVGALVVEEDICHLPRPTPNLYIGKGKAEEIAEISQAKGVDLVIFNNDLTGTQHKNLEKVLNVKVIDRTQLILDIFGRRARSPEGKAQVELAQLEYRLPRLPGKGTELSRLGGGIGTRGPGEQKLEEDRRRIRERIIRLKGDLKDLELRRQTLRTRREEFSLPTVVFVGYTSAGKSTLFNALTGSEQLISWGLFTTLDPLARAITLSNHQKVILSDTVGFIRQLPAHLIEAFKATLEEVVQADLLIHILDISSPKAKDHYKSVLEVLRELGAAEKKTILALNKIDLIQEEGVIKRLVRDYPDGVPISALKRQNLEMFLKKVEEELSGYSSEIKLVLPLNRMDLVDFIYSQGKVKDITYSGKDIHVTALLPVVAAKKLKAYSKSSLFDG